MRNLEVILAFTWEFKELLLAITLGLTAILCLGYYIIFKVILER